MPGRRTIPKKAAKKTKPRTKLDPRSEKNIEEGRVPERVLISRHQRRSSNRDREGILLKKKKLTPPKPSKLDIKQKGCYKVIMDILSPH